MENFQHNHNNHYQMIHLMLYYALNVVYPNDLVELLFPSIGEPSLILIQDYFLMDDFVHI